MKILVLASEIPATTTMPGSPRLFSLCKALSARHQLTLLIFADGLGRRERFQGDPSTENVFEHIETLPAAPAPAWWGRQRHRLTQEVHFGTRLRTPAYYRQIRQRLAELVADGGFDALFVDGLQNSQFVTPGFPCPAVIDLHDCVTLLYTRKTRVEPPGLRKMQLYFETRSMARWEKALGQTFNATVVNSAVDQEYLRELDPSGNFLAIGNGVDGEFFRPGRGRGDPSKLVFTGVMDYGPNEDAALFFVQDILPLIRAEHPGVQTAIVGKNPTARVQALGTESGVRITGEVADVRPFLEEAGIFVCPLRWGAGVKNKLLAALAMEKAIVATPTSIEGLDLHDNVHLLLAATPAEFAAQVDRLVRDPGLAARLAAAGKLQVTNTYSWTGSGRVLEQVLIDLVSRGSSAATMATTS